MSNTDQIDYWNGDGGQKWVRFSNLLDGMMLPFAEAILEAAKLQRGESVLDVGCGAGALSLAAAQAVGDTGRVQGVDVSEPLLGLAKERAVEAGGPINFQAGDASTFQTSAAADVLVSRFGVMFFDDPAAAFANLKTNIAADGRLAFACWQSLAHNAWARAPLEAALPFLNAPPTPPAPGSPGPFAFADAAHIKTLLTDAGWTNISIAPWQGDLILPGDTPPDAAAFMMQLGPVARLVEQDGADLAAVSGALEQRMQDLADENGRVAMQSAAWIVTADA